MVLAVGCVHTDTATQIIDIIIDKPVAIEAPTSTLPDNPSIPPAPPNTNNQSFEIMHKEYDSSWRIRWPSAFAEFAGPGSYTMLDGLHRAEFRSWDTDNGANRPSYTMPYSAWNGAGEVLAILYDKNEIARGWVRRVAGVRGPM